MPRCQNFCGLSLSTYGLGLEGSGLGSGLESCSDNNNNNNNNNAICIAQIRKKQQMGCSQCPKRKAFSLALNVSIDMSVDRKSFGRLFHTEGPWTVDNVLASP